MVSIPLFTAMSDLKGFEERKGPARPLGVRHKADPERETWSEARARETRDLGANEQPYCLVIGGGQGGIMLGARLRQLGVPAIIIEKNARPGDSWRNRYRTLVLHDPVWYDHLPYIPLPETAGVYAQGQNGRLAGNVYARHGAQLLGRHNMRQRRLTRPKRPGRSSWIASAGASR
jgi:UDP-N-acetylglucosamine:LPS N-acetylglucosamine transferase